MILLNLLINHLVYIMTISKQIFFIIGLILISFYPEVSISSPCNPSDPDGENPGNLCFVHLAKPYQSTFKQGYASDGYFGVPVGPGIPGNQIIPSHQSGTPIDRRIINNGFWTNIESSSNGSTVRTSTGKEWKIPSIKFP